MPNIGKLSVVEETLRQLFVDEYSTSNLVTTASSTHLPEQKETIHMINQLRHEACSGSVDDLAHVVSVDCLSDCLTKASARPDFLIKAVDTGFLPNCDKHPPFRELMRNKHKAYAVCDATDELISWLCKRVDDIHNVHTFLNIRVDRHISYYLQRN